MIKKLLQFSLGNKFAIFLMVLLVILGGIYSASKMKLELIPDIEEPTITVQTVEQGATPETVKSDISDKIDEQVRSMAKVSNVSSQSMANASMVTVKYNRGTDMDKAENDLKKEIDKIKFKKAVEEPDLVRNNVNTFPVVAYSFTDKDNNLNNVTKKVKNNLIPKLQTVSGVQNAQTNGQTSKEIGIKFNKKALQEKGLDQQSVQDYIKDSSDQSPLGLFQFKDKEKSIVLDGHFRSLSALKNLEIPLSVSKNSDSEGSQKQRTKKGEPTVRLTDIADVTEGNVRESISKTNGKDAVNVQVTKAQDANAVQVASNVRKEINQFTKKNPGLKATKVMDTAKPIEDSIYTMVEKAALGTIVAIIIILLFLRNIRTTAISIVSIPMSILIALIAMKLCDISLNILTLGALTVAIGRVIDDSIVVIENIYRRLSNSAEKEAGESLIVSATKEVFKPIMSSTIVTIVVFLPLAFIQGSVGEMFRPFALAITFSLLASLLVSITIVPALGSTLFKRGIRKRSVNNSLGTLSTSYRKILHWSLNHKWIVIIISTVILFFTIVIGGTRIGTSFISTGEDKYLALTYKPEPGETEKSVLDHAEQVQKYLNGKSKVKTVQYSVGGASPQDPTGNTNNLALMVEYDKNTPNFDEEPDKVLHHVDKFKHPGSWNNQDLGTGGDNNTIKVKVQGETLGEINDTAKKVEHLMKKNSALTNVKSDLTQTYQEYQIHVDHNKAANKGIKAKQLALALNENAPEETITSVKENGHSINVKVRKDKERHWSKEKLEQVKIPSPTGQEVQLSDIATLEKGETPNKLETESGNYQTTVTGKAINKDVGGVSSDVLSQVKKIDKPRSVSIDVGGASEDIDEAISQLTFAMIAAVIIVYLVLVLTFKGALAPFTILFSLPYTAIGVIIALLITGETFSVSTLIGMLMLIGIVVTNAIVLVDRVINNQQEGMAMKEALIEAGGTRIRPILMTALATIGALIPLLFGQDSSILISKGLAAAVVGGLISSTLLTLIVVPVIYEILFTLKDKIVRRNKTK
ncbi:efflux RND transporter permease subunit [Staphylococcus sp. SQ8-PEA]|uniref:Efflux RND transporter permease subunit n=1 Tax=Staphylococcus marylandisciuri TaxID=2981529 RepID=A0ABT2QMH1_9STAP|nr:efflux RND transporter permease subunit [Staphylococcus marylandisciuri]MCU5745170.1 efflux RND transporter permease subunit [Staphylococcus marylandisciuri]